MRVQANIRLGGRAAYYLGTCVNAVFVAAGLFVAYPAYQRYLAEGMSRAALQQIAFGLGFVAVGLVAQVVLRRRDRRDEAADRLRGAHPDAPWRWRADWASRRLTDESGAGMAGMIFFAVVWNAFSWPLAIYVTQNDAGTGSPWLVWLFPAVGVGVAFAAGFMVLRRRKFGRSVFELNAVPGRVGGVLSGVAVTGVRAGEVPADGFHACLSCYHRRVTYSRDAKGNSRRNVDETLLWRDEKRLRGMPTGAPARLALPVRFDVPSDQPETTLENPDDRILWRVELSAELPGIDYAARFEVPVFRVDAPGAEDGAATAPDAGAYAAYELRRDLRAPVSRGIRIERGAGHDVAFTFGAARNRGMAAVATILFAVMAAIAIALAAAGAAFIGVGITGLMAAAAGYGAWTSWTQASRVTVHDGRVEVTRGAFGRGTPETVDAAEVRVAVGARMGERAYYDLCIDTRDGRTVKAATTLEDREEADWIAAELRRCIGTDEAALT